MRKPSFRGARMKRHFINGARKATLGVFENNLPAYYCYKAVGFRDVPLETPEIYPVLGQDWNCLELAIER